MIPQVGTDNKVKSIFLQLTEYRKRRGSVGIRRFFLSLLLGESRADRVPGHVRQSKDEFVFNEPVKIEPARAKNAFNGFRVIVGVELIFVGNNLHTITDINRHNHRLQAALANHGRLCLHMKIKKQLILRIAAALNLPADQRLRLARKIADQSAELHYRLFALRFAAKPGKLKNIS